MTKVVLFVIVHTAFTSQTDSVLLYGPYMAANIAFPSIFLTVSNNDGSSSDIVFVLRSTTIRTSQTDSSSLALIVLCEAMRKAGLVDWGLSRSLSPTLVSQFSFSYSFSF